MPKKIDYLTFGEVWRWVGHSAGLFDVMIIGPTSNTRWIKEERWVVVLRASSFSAAATYEQGAHAVFNGFADKRWQHINA